MFISATSLAGGTATTIGVAVVGTGLLYLLRRRSITTVLTATVLTAIVVVATGVLGSVAATLRGSQLDNLLVSMSVAALLSVAIGVGLAKLIMAASVELRRAVRLLDQYPELPLPDAPTAELRAVANELSLTRQRLAEARAREKAVEHSRRELLAWIGHDLRGPLARITAIAEGLEDGVVEPAETNRYHRAIRLQAERLAALVDDIFELAAIDAGTLRPSLVSMNLADLISDALAGAQPAAEGKQITLTGDAPRHLAVHADPRLLWRVLDNLLSNALRETPPGGTVEIIARDRVDAVCLEVRDTCGGISQDAVARVFDPGFRVDPARSADGCAGLGLTIARGFVNALRGDLTVQNTEIGCSFLAMLPKNVLGKRG